MIKSRVFQKTLSIRAAAKSRESAHIREKHPSKRLTAREDQRYVGENVETAFTIEQKLNDVVSRKICILEHSEHTLTRGRRRKHRLLNRLGSR